MAVILRKRMYLNRKKNKNKNLDGNSQLSVKKKRCDIGRVNYKKIKKKCVTAIYET